MSVIMDIVQSHRTRAELEAENGRLREQVRQQTKQLDDQGEQIRHERQVAAALQAEIARLRAALESLTKDPPATLDEPDTDAEVIIKMRAIARATLSEEEAS